ncbi:MAG: glycerol kinase GlpK [Pseudomonadales bacterium]|jgi:glycerol kinase|nr:glycerol kinase GlpK [Pseudomonadales bacterium]
MTYLLAIDQGTTSSRAILFSVAGEQVGVAQQEFHQHFPEDGWVEHDPEDIWQSTIGVCRAVLSEQGVSAADIAGIGITNQRETTIVWDRHTGEPVYRAIVWQDRRTADFCEELKGEGLEPWFTEKTGLLLDPYFSGTKVKWILDHVDGARERAKNGDLLFGTVDTFLLWRLTGGQSHKTDATNASRTLLFNIHTQAWDEELLARLNIPAAMLPEVEDCSADFGETESGVFGGSIPVLGIAGDQQAALIGQGCFETGMIKSTYGTGCFVIMNTGHEAITSQNKLLTTVAYRLNGEVTYGLEGSIFIAGAAVQWLRDGLKLITSASESEAIASGHPTSHGVYLVPAFTGLGAPYWDPNARGAILGLTRDSGIGDIVTATLQSVCFQTQDLLSAMQHDGAVPTILRVDGGMVENNWVVQHLADILQLPVDRPQVIETTALGVAYLAGLKAGVFGNTEELGKQWRLERRFEPEMASETAHGLYHGWLDAVNRVRT